MATNSNDYKTILKNCGLEQYISVFEKYGYDDLDWMRTLSKDRLMSFLCSDNVKMLEGHFHKFYCVLHSPILPILLPIAIILLLSYWGDFGPETFLLEISAKIHAKNAFVLFVI